jgi:hypothetical protein
MRTRVTRSLAILISATAMMMGSDAGAADAGIAVGEVLPPPPSTGIDAAVLREAAEGEIRDMGPTKATQRRKVVVSLALTHTAVDPVACAINATIRDARTGAMIAIIEGNAHSNGPVSVELRKQVAHAAVRSAVRRIPSALVTK